MDRKTPFYAFHKFCDAKLVPFAGYIMPIQYKGVNFEHNHVRNHVGVFDVSHMTILDFTGDEVVEFLRYLLSNDIDTIIEDGDKAIIKLKESVVLSFGYIQEKKSLSRSRIEGLQFIDKNF